MKYVALAVLALACLTDTAQSQSVRPMSDRGRFHGYVSKKPYSCTWSATSYCAAWRAGTLKDYVQQRGRPR
jgi:hypothetical protein